MPAAARSVSPAAHLDLQDVFDRNHAAWEALDPDKIVALYAADASFWVQGAPRIEGRAALRQHFAKLAAQFGRFGWDVHRLMFGDRHWVFEYDMLIDMKDRNGEAFTARVPMVDIVNVNDAGEVTRKDVFVDNEARQAAFQRAGLA